MGWCGLHSCGSGYESATDSCEHGNEPSGFTKGNYTNRDQLLAYGVSYSSFVF
jgi:hypothetical protein